MRGSALGDGFDEQVAGADVLAVHHHHEAEDPLLRERQAAELDRAGALADLRDVHLERAQLGDDVLTVGVEDLHLQLVLARRRPQLEREEALLVLRGEALHEDAVEDAEDAVLAADLRVAVAEDEVAELVLGHGVLRVGGAKATAGPQAFQRFVARTDDPNARGSGFSIGLPARIASTAILRWSIVSRWRRRRSSSIGPR